MFSICRLHFSLYYQIIPSDTHLVYIRVGVSRHGRTDREDWRRFLQWLNINYPKKTNFCFIINCFSWKNNTKHSHHSVNDFHRFQRMGRNLLANFQHVSFAFKMHLNRFCKATRVGTTSLLLYYSRKSLEVLTILMFSELQAPIR